MKLFKTLYEIYINFNYEYKGHEVIYVRKHKVLNSLGKEYKCGMFNSFPKNKEDQVFRSWSTYRAYTFDKSKVNSLIKQVKEANVKMFDEELLSIEEDFDMILREYESQKEKLTEAKEHWEHLRDTFDAMDEYYND